MENRKPLATAPIPTRFKDKAELYRVMLVQRGIYEIWHPMTFEDYEGREYAEAVKAHLDAGVAQGMILTGPNGTGKTMLLNLAMKYAFGDLGKLVFVMDFRELVKQYTLSWRGNGNLEEVMNSDYLGIDDIGKEFNQSEMSKELAITALDYVLRYRYQRQLPTWITTNILLQDFRTEYNEHIASLLKRCSVGMHIVGKDYGNGQSKVLKP